MVSLDVLLKLTEFVLDFLVIVRVGFDETDDCLKCLVGEIVLFVFFIGGGEVVVGIGPIWFGADGLLEASNGLVIVAKRILKRTKIKSELRIKRIEGNGLRIGCD